MEWYQTGRNWDSGDWRSKKISKTKVLLFTLDSGIDVGHKPRA